MTLITSSAPRLLLVEDDEELLGVLQDVLREEGYEVTTGTSLKAALAEVSRQVFDLILADVVGWTAEAPLGAVSRLRQAAQPTPVGLVTGWKLSAEEVAAEGFAFLVPKPFHLDDLLTRVAEGVARPLTPEQERAAALVRRYCAAIDGHDWQACAALCREDVRYFPSPGSLFDRKREVVGRAALLEQLEYNAVVAPDVHYEACYFYGRPDGIAARYLATIATPEGRVRFAGGMLFRVEGEQIVEIGYRLDAEHLRAWEAVAGG